MRRTSALAAIRREHGAEGVRAALTEATAHATASAACDALGLHRARTGANVGQLRAAFARAGVPWPEAWTREAVSFDTIRAALRDHGSVRAAARALGLDPAGVSRRVRAACTCADASHGHALACPIVWGVSDGA